VPIHRILHPFDCSMKPTLTLTSVLRTAVAATVARLPSNVSLAVGVDVEDNPDNPYFMEIRLSSSGLTQMRERIVFESEAQVMQALAGLHNQLALAPAKAALAAPRKGFVDLDRELAVLGTTAGLAS
jgi:hypothetical protein